VPRWKNVLRTADDVYRIKREAVLREATRIISRQGYHNTSLDDIAEALQVAKGTLYNYVKDKQEILFECHMMSLDLGEAAFSFAESHGSNGYTKLRLMFRAYLTWLNAVLGGGGVASDVTALRLSDQDIVIVRRDEAQERLITYFEQGFADRSLRSIDARLAIYTLMGAVNSIQSWFTPKGRLSLDQLVTGVIDILMRGIAVDVDARPPDVPIPAHPSDSSVFRAHHPLKRGRRRQPTTSRDSSITQPLAPASSD
jgi:AcrR family transcriptional regulator